MARDWCPAGRIAIISCRSAISDADGNLIGAQLMGPRATDMIAELALALKVGVSVETIAETIHPHPTVSEVIAEAAHDWEGLCCHSLPKKK